MSEREYDRMPYSVQIEFRTAADGLKDPQTAMNRAASVVPCAPDIESVERAVLD